MLFFAVLVSTLHLLILLFRRFISFFVAHSVSNELWVDGLLCLETVIVRTLEHPTGPWTHLHCCYVLVCTLLWFLLFIDHFLAMHSVPRCENLARLLGDLDVQLSVEHLQVAYGTSLLFGSNKVALPSLSNLLRLKALNAYASNLQ